MWEVSGQLQNTETRVTRGRVVQLVCLTLLRFRMKTPIRSKCDSGFGVKTHNGIAVNSRGKRPIRKIKTSPLVTL